MAETRATASVPKSGPRDVFMHLLAIVTLYASVISFIGLLWQYINVWYPDPLNYYYTGILNSIRWSASILVVMYPVYVLMMWLINRDYHQQPERREIRVRKWLIYLTLFISALTVIIDVISLIYNFFGGEVSIRFFLKVLVVLVAAAAVFGYYFFDLRDKGVKNLKLLAWIVSLIIAGVVVGGFLIVGSPAHQRAMNFDERRINDLSSIQYEIVYNYWQQKGSLPAQLTDLTNSISPFAVPVDPETGAPYEYTLQSALGFELCANFKLATTQQSQVPKPVFPNSDTYNQNWSHAAGRVCFDRVIDPTLYKPQAQPLPLK